MVRRVLGLERELRTVHGGAGVPGRWALLFNNAFGTASSGGFGFTQPLHGTVEIIWRPLAFDNGQLIGTFGDGLGRFNIQVGADGVINVVIRLGDTTLISRGVTVPLTLGDLYQLSIVHDRDEPELQLYINGFPNMIPGEGSASDHSGSRINFCSFNDSSTNPTQRHHCELYQVRFWTALLTQEQIQERMFKELSPPMDSLARYYAFNEGAGDTILDHGSHGNNATVFGAEWVRRPRLTVQPQIPPPPLPLDEMWVSAISGSPFGDGSEGNPYDTLLRATLSIKDGSKVHLERGSHFRSMLTIDADDVEVDTYGSGPMPLVDCSDPASAGQWSVADGLDDVYEVSWTHQMNGSMGLLTVWEDGVMLTYRATLTEVEAEPGTFHAQSTSSNPAVISVHPFGSTDPRTDGKLYEITRRDSGVFQPEARTGLLLEDVHARRNGHEGGSIRIGRDGTMRRCLAEDGNKHNILIRAGSVAEDCVAWKAEHGVRTSDKSLFVGFDIGTAPIGKTVVFRRCWAVGPGAGYIFHTDGANKFAEVEIDGGGIHGPFVGGFFNHTDKAIVQNLFIEDVLEPLQPFVDELVTDNVTMLGCRSVQPTGNVGVKWEVRDLRVQLGFVVGAVFWNGIDGELDIDNSVVLFGSNTATLFRQNHYTNLSLHDSILHGFWENYNYRDVPVVPEGARNLWSRSEADPHMRWWVDEVSYTNDLPALQAAHAGLEEDSTQVTSVGFLVPSLVSSEGVMLTATNSPARTGGRAAGSIKHIPRPRWTWLEHGWAQGQIEPAQPPGETFQVQAAYAATAPGESVVIDLGQRSRPSSGSMLVLQSLGVPGNGSRTIVGGTVIEYTPDTGFEGVDSLTFGLMDSGSEQVQTVTCHIAVGAGSSS